MVAAQSKKAVIIGGGIAGPAAAIALKMAGIDSVIYEGQAGPEDQDGGWLNVMPNGLGVLATLGLDHVVRSEGFQCTELVFHDHRGRRIAAMPSRGVSVRRGFLHAALRREAERLGVPMVFGKRLGGIEAPRGSSVLAHFEDGTSAEGDFLIGCDGIHSRTRQLVLPGAPRPEYMGIVESIGFGKTATLPPSDGPLLMFSGRKGFFAYLVRESGEVYWFYSMAVPDEPDKEVVNSIPHQEWVRRMLDDHGGDGNPAPEVINSTATPVGRHPIYVLEVLPRWHEGLVCLAGDAAHATTPHIGQGSSMALEDAIVLAKCLRDVEDPEPAFETYQRLREPRVRAIVELARHNSSTLVADNFLSRMVRKVLMPYFLKRSVAAGGWMYDYHIDWDEKVG